MKQCFRILLFVLAVFLLLGIAQEGTAQSRVPSKRTTISPRKKPTTATQPTINVNFKGDLGRFALKGPVKYMKDMVGGGGPEYYFNSDGFLSESDGSPLKADENNEQYTRDSQGRITIYDKFGFNWKEEYEFNSNGLLERKRSTNISGSNRSDDRYTYNSEGECVSCSSVYFQLGEQGKQTIKYTILTRDKYGNWTKRKDQHGNIETRKITYYE